MNPLAQLLGESAGVAAVREQLAHLLEHHLGGARRLPPILVQGETGTGKGLLAAAIHRAGPRASGPFVDVNCAAIPDALLEAELFGFERGAFTDARQAKPGLLQTAHRGILFLDEIGLMPEALQAKLLKAIEERVVRRLGGTRAEPVDVWIVAATSEDLASAVRARRFREDLYHRLALVTFRLPPLRERGGDVERLARHFLRLACEDYGLPPKVLTAEALAALAAYPWPGNVRELANVMERVALLGDGDRVTPEALGLPPPPAGPPGVSAGAPDAGAAAGAAGEERERLLAALRAAGGNLSRAAARLGIPRNTLRYRLEKHGLVTPGDPGARGREAPAAPGRPSEPAPAPPAPPAEAGPRRVRWESRRVTLLYARLGGRDASSGADPGRALELVLEKVRSFGGQVSELSPTGLVAAFGLTPGEDAARRAGHAALVLRATLARGRPEDGAPGIRLAIHTAQLLVGRVGPAAEIDADAMREARAALDALVARAAPGDVVVGGGAARHLGRRFALAPLEDATGVPPVCRLTGHATQGRETRFVGRDLETRVLFERFEQAAGGQGQIVSVVGEPGIGKSRLLAELARGVQDRAAWIEGQAMSFGRAMPLHPVVDLVRRMLGAEEGEREAAVVERIDERLRDLGDDLLALAPFLRYLLGVAPGDPRVAAMDPKLRRAELFDALCRLLIRAARRSPLVVVLEDVHWADPATEEWLALVGDRVATRRILLVLTYRQGYVPPLGDRSFHTRLPLAALSAADSVEMARGLLAAAELPEPLRALITGKAEGNPFFVEEVVRSLEQAGALRREGDVLALARPLDEIVVPDTVEDVIQARLDRLDEGPRLTLEVASVVGREFTRRLLERVVERPDEVAAHLRALVALELVSEKSLSPEPVFAFRHALTYEVAYRSVPPERRRALHRAAAAAIEALFPERLPEQAEVLADHLTRAEDWSRALPYLLRAAERAAHAFAIHHALARYGEALEAMRRGGTADRGTAIAIHRARSTLAFLVSDFDRSRAEAEVVLAIAREVGDRDTEAEALAAIGWAATWARDLGGAVASARRAIEVAGQGPAPRALGRAHLTIGFVRGVTGGLEEAREETDRALAASQAAGDATHASLALAVSGLIRGWEGDFEAAARVQARGLAIAREGNLLVPLLLGFFLYGMTLTGKGDYDEAMALYEEGLALAEKIGDEAVHHRLLNCLGWLYAELGDFDRALVLNARSAEVGRRRRDPGTLPNAHVNLGDVLLAKGDLPLARDHFEEAMGIARDPTRSDWMKWRYRIRLHASLGEWWLANGDPGRALGCADECRELAMRTGSRKNLVKGWRLAGDVARARRRWDDAEAAYGEALAAAAAVGNPTQLWRTRLALAAMREEAGRVDGAMEAYRAGREVVERIRRRLGDGRLRERFSAMPEVRRLLDKGAPR